MSDNIMVRENVLPAEDLYRPDKMMFNDLIEMTNQKYELIENESLDYISAQHITSDRLRDSIEKYGLLPREITNFESNHPGLPSHENKVYFMTDDRDSYTNTVHKIGGREMAVEAHLNPENLTYDEDAFTEGGLNHLHHNGITGEKLGIASLVKLGTVAHVGPIYPSESEAPAGESFITNYDIIGDLRGDEDFEKSFRERGYFFSDKENEGVSQDLIEERQSKVERFDSQLSFEELSKILS